MKATTAPNFEFLSAMIEHKMTIQRVEIVAMLLGLALGGAAFAGCGIGPCGDTKTVDEFPIESSSYTEDFYAGDGGSAEVPLRHGHGEKTMVIDRASNTMQLSYFDNDLRPVVETWRIEGIEQVEGWE